MMKHHAQSSEALRSPLRRCSSPSIKAHKGRASLISRALSKSSIVSSLPPLVSMRVLSKSSIVSPPPPVVYMRMSTDITPHLYKKGL